MVRSGTRNGLCPVRERNEARERPASDDDQRPSEPDSRGDSALLESERLLSEDQLGSGLVEARQSGDGQVLVVKLRIVREDVGCLREKGGQARSDLKRGTSPQAFHLAMQRGYPKRTTYLLHDGQDPGLSLVGPVCPGSEVDLVRGRVRLEGRGESKDPAGVHKKNPVSATERKKTGD